MLVVDLESQTLESIPLVEGCFKTSGVEGIGSWTFGAETSLFEAGFAEGRTQPLIEVVVERKRGKKATTVQAWCETQGRTSLLTRVVRPPAFPGGASIRVSGFDWLDRRCQ